MLPRALLYVAGCLWLCAPAAWAQEPQPQATEKPGMNVYPADDAERPKFPRVYPGAPPLMPHGAGALQVKLKNNECLDCHTPPESHFFNPFTGKKTPEKVIRFNCVQCHVPQALEATP